MSETKQKPQLPKFNFKQSSMTEAELEAKIEENKPKFVDESKFFRSGEHEVEIQSSSFEGMASDPTFAKWVVTYGGVGEKKITEMLFVPTTDKVTYTDSKGNESTFAIQKLKSFLIGLGEEFSLKGLPGLLSTYFSSENALTGSAIKINVGYPGLHIGFMGKNDAGENRLCIVTRNGEKLERAPQEFATHKEVEDYAASKGIELKRFTEVLGHSKSSTASVKKEVNKNW